MRNAYKIFVGKCEWKYARWEDLDVGEWIILKLILRKMDGTVFVGFIWLRIWADGRLLEHGNEPYGSIKGGQFLE
jgi:hypothetical protein